MFVSEGSKRSREERINAYDLLTEEMARKTMDDELFLLGTSAGSGIGVGTSYWSGYFFMKG
mgnify:CR=1 FL=1